jgi:hypothetical protein
MEQCLSGRSVVYVTVRHALPAPDTLIQVTRGGLSEDRRAGYRGTRSVERGRDASLLVGDEDRLNGP